MNFLLIRQDSDTKVNTKINHEKVVNFTDPVIPKVIYKQLTYTF